MSDVEDLNARRAERAQEAKNRLAELGVLDKIENSILDGMVNVDARGDYAREESFQLVMQLQAARHVSKEIDRLIKAGEKKAEPKRYGP